MIAVAEQPSAPAEHEPFYSERRIRYWLLHWGDLMALAESPGSAHGLTSSKPTQNTPRVGKFAKGSYGDRLRWTVVKADIESAWLALPRLSLERHIVLIHMHGYDLQAVVDRETGLTYQDARTALDHAVKTMSETLEGVHEEMLHPYADEPDSNWPRQCRNCGAPLGEDRRSDAIYCSDACKQRDWRETQG